MIPPETIKGLMDEIRRLVKEVKTQNDFNQILIKDSLNILNFTLNALLGTNDKSPGVYGATGKPGQGVHNKSMLDCKR